MKDKILEHCPELINETIANIQKLVRINSARDEAHKEANKPFGPGVDQAFDTFLEMAQSLNMRTFKDPDGVYAYAELGPEDGQLFGILGHLDVVPGLDPKLWTLGQPFSGDIVDNMIVGRGSLDDKGPVVISMMAIKGLLDLGYEFKSRIRVIVGGAEETTWECIEKYKAEQEIPVVSFSPDAQFPLIFAEKGLLQFDGYANNSYDFEVEADGAYNAVCDKATYRGDKTNDVAAELDKLGFAYETNSDGSISVIGKSAHAKDCNLGTNAVLRLAIAMYNVGIHAQTIDFLAEKIKETSFAEGLFDELQQDEVSGNLTLNIAGLVIKDGKETIKFDSRIPVLVDEKVVGETYANALRSYGLTYEQVDYLHKLYVAQDSLLVTTLMDAYQTITGDMESKPLSNGGATYSRAWENCVAFGMVFEKQGMTDKMHQPDEVLEIKFIEPALQIYSLAIYNLDQIDFR